MNDLKIEHEQERTLLVLQQMKIQYENTVLQVRLEAQLEASVARQLRLPPDQHAAQQRKERLTRLLVSLRELDAMIVLYTPKEEQAVTGATEKLDQAAEGALYTNGAHG